MKRFYLFLGLLLGVLSATAQTTTTYTDVTLIVNIPDGFANVCYYTNNNGETVYLTQGENSIATQYVKTTNTDGSSNAYFQSVTLNIQDSGTYKFTSCTVTSSTGTSNYEGYYGSLYPNTYLTLTSYLTWTGGTTYTFNPVISSLAASRTASATLNVTGDPARMSLSCGSYSPSFTGGTNTINFNPSTESNWTIGPSTSGQYLSGVTKNGSPVSDNGYGTYYLTVSQGDVIVVNTEAATVTRNVSFVFPNGNSGVVTGVWRTENYAKTSLIPNWQSGFTTSDKELVIMSLNINDYNITEYTINGASESTPTSSDQYLTINEDKIISITAAPFANNNIAISAPDPESITISYATSQYSSYTELNGLTAGNNNVELSEKMTYFKIEPKGAGIIDRIAYKNSGDADYTEVTDYYGTYYVPISDGMSLIADAHMKVRNEQVTMRINNMSRINYIYLSYQDGTKIYDNMYGPVPIQGENTFVIDSAGDNPITLSFNLNSDDPAITNVYNAPFYVLVNGEKATPTQGDGNFNKVYSLTLNAGDYIDIYPGDAYSADLASLSATISARQNITSGSSFAYDVNAAGFDSYTSIKVYLTRQCYSDANTFTIIPVTHYDGYAVASTFSSVSSANGQLYVAGYDLTAGEYTTDTKVSFYINAEVTGTKNGSTYTIKATSDGGNEFPFATLDTSGGTPRYNNEFRIADNAFAFSIGTEFIAESVTYQRTMKATDLEHHPGTYSWQPWFMPFDVTFAEAADFVAVHSSGNLEILKFNRVEDSTVYFDVVKPVSSDTEVAMEANTPYIFLPINTGYKDFTFNEKTIKTTSDTEGIGTGSYKMYGNYTGVSMGTGDETSSYALSNGTFSKANGSSTLPPFRVRLKQTSGSAAPARLQIARVEGGTSSEEEMVNDLLNDMMSGDAVIYDMQGRRVNNPGRGMFIINGRKVVIR